MPNGLVNQPEHYHPHRAWGDGATRTGEHTIEAISHPDGWIVCLCAARVERVTDEQGVIVLSLEDAWNLHRTPDTRGGAALPHAITQRVIRAAYVARATDGEVSDFLAAIEDPRYVPAVLRVEYDRGSVDVEWR